MDRSKLKWEQREKRILEQSKLEQANAKVSKALREHKIKGTGSLVSYFAEETGKTSQSVRGFAGINFDMMIVDECSDIINAPVSRPDNFVIQSGRRTGKSVFRQEMIKRRMEKSLMEMTADVMAVMVDFMPTNEEIDAITAKREQEELDMIVLEAEREAHGAYGVW